MTRGWSDGDGGKETETAVDSEKKIWTEGPFLSFLCNVPTM